MRLYGDEGIFYTRVGMLITNRCKERTWDSSSAGLATGVADASSGVLLPIALTFRDMVPAQARLALT